MGPIRVQTLGTQNFSEPLNNRKGPSQGLKHTSAHQGAHKGNLAPRDPGVPAEHPPAALSKSPVFFFLSSDTFWSALDICSKSWQNWPKCPWQFWTQKMPVAIFVMPVKKKCKFLPVTKKMPVAKNKYFVRDKKKLPVTFLGQFFSRTLGAALFSIEILSELFCCPWQSLKMPVTILQKSSVAGETCPWYFEKTCPRHFKNARDNGKKKNFLKWTRQRL